MGVPESKDIIVPQQEPPSSIVNSITLEQKIYFLRLNNEKYYIGRTIDVDRRYNERPKLFGPLKGDEHLQGEGSVWTSKYHPIEIIETRVSTSPFDEDTYVMEYMNLHGIENVRGGTYSNIELTDEQRSYIERMLRGATDRCYQCGDLGHFAKDCISNTIPPPQYCQRCGRNNHETIECYAQTHFNGTILDDKKVMLEKYASVAEITNSEEQLFEVLKRWRLQSSRRLGIKAYLIFADTVLIDLSFYKPTTLENLLRIRGVGPIKIEQYGSEILEILKKHKESSKYDTVDQEDKKLFEVLKRWRLEHSRRLGIKAYLIFADTVLIDLSVYKPTTLTTLLRIRGVGPKKIEEYGSEIIEIIRSNAKIH